MKEERDRGMMRDQAQKFAHDAACPDRRSCRIAAKHAGDGWVWFQTNYADFGAPSIPAVPLTGCARIARWAT
jgi:hypothetical protein